MLTPECLLQLCQARREAALVAGGGVLVQRTLLNALVDHGRGLSELGGGGLLVASGQGFAEGAQGAAQARGVGAVHVGAFLCLTGALQRRKMICHKAVLTFVRGELSRKFFHFARNKILYGIAAGAVKHAGTAKGRRY